MPPPEAGWVHLSCSCFAPSQGSAENSLRSQQQDQDQDDERNDVRPLRISEQDLPIVADEAEEQTAEECAADVADAAEYRGRKRLDAQNETAAVLDAGRDLHDVERAAAPASRPPMTKVVMMMRSLLTPISVAVSGSWATARMPRPVRDLRMNRSVRNHHDHGGDNDDQLLGVHDGAEDIEDRGRPEHGQCQLRAADRARGRSGTGW